MYCATKEARAIALKEDCPVLIEAMSYRWVRAAVS
jgi:TPP-dependent pyruvate/acetoin dehydrogenase alpha subunit